MNKWYGKIGFAENVETAPSVYSEVIEEHSYYGDILRNNRRLQQGSNSPNSDIVISNQISVVADAYLNNHFYNIRWIEFLGAKWKVTDVDATTAPRLSLTLGEMWNEDET